MHRVAARSSSRPLPANAGANWRRRTRAARVVACGGVRAEVERLRALLHNCRRFGPESQNHDGHADFAAHLRGRVAWVASLDPAKGARLRAAFEQIRWT